MKYTLLLSYLVVLLIAEAFCAPAPAPDSDHVSNGQQCFVDDSYVDPNSGATMPVHIEGNWKIKFGGYKTNCNGYAWNPRSYASDVDLMEMSCWFQAKCGAGNPGTCLNDACVPVDQNRAEDWTKDWCPRGEDGVKCYVPKNRQGFNGGVNTVALWNSDPNVQLDYSSQPVSAAETTFETTASNPDTSYLAANTVGDSTGLNDWTTNTFY